MDGMGDRMARDAVKSTVVIVGDDTGTRDSVAMLLEIHGFLVRQYADPSGCLADAASFGARLVLARPVPPLELVADVRGLTG